MRSVQLMKRPRWQVPRSLLLSRACSGFRYRWKYSALTLAKFEKFKSPWKVLNTNPRKNSRCSKWKSEYLNFRYLSTKYQKYMTKRCWFYRPYCQNDPNSFADKNNNFTVFKISLLNKIPIRRPEQFPDRNREVTDISPIKHWGPLPWIVNCLYPVPASVDTSPSVQSTRLMKEK